MRRFLRIMKGSRFSPMRIGAVLLLLISVWGFTDQDTEPRRFRPYVSFALAQSMEDEDTPNGSGFLWTDTAGWISMNCLNDWDENPGMEDRCTTQGTYGVTLDFAVGTGEGTLSGYGWSPNVGFVCFGRTCGGCSGISCGDALSGTLVDARFDTDEAQEVSATRRIAFVHGFGRILAHANEGGWIDLEGRGDGTNPEDGGVGAFLDDTTLTLAGSGWQQNSDRTGVGWVYFGDSPPGNSPCTDETCRTRCNPSDDPSCPRVTFPPARETECADGDCCSNSMDDDRDINYAADSIHNPLDRDPQDEEGRPSGGATDGVDCFDYDCAGQRFYSRNEYNSGITDNFNVEHCGAPPGNSPADNTENGFSVADCFDGLDNDLDELIWNETERRFVLNPDVDAGKDCSDADCTTAEFGGERCTAEELEEDVYNGCYDGVDNDGDAQVDCADDQCNDAENGYALCPGRIPSCLCASHPRAQGYEVPDCNALTNDRDGDGVVNSCDNCPGDSNSGQQDTDADGVQTSTTTGGDVCDPIAWLETREGSLYAQLLSGTPPPVGSKTATYCILTARDNTGTSVQMGQFQSGRCELPPTGVIQFRIISGERAITLVAGTGTNSVRAYLDLTPLRLPAARNVVELTTSDAPDTLTELNSKRYHVRGDLRINETIQFPAGSDGVTILVDGNLEFGPDAALSYEAASSLLKLTSVAWIVTGNITIDPNVSDLVGTFLSTGTVSTGTKAPAPDESLTIQGLVIAREFRLQRQFASPDRGSELIIYDGRAILNPPPGLADLVKALPTFRSIAPQ